MLPASRSFQVSCPPRLLNWAHCFRAFATVKDEGLRRCRSPVNQQVYCGCRVPNRNRSFSRGTTFRLAARRGGCASRRCRRLPEIRRSRRTSRPPPRPMRHAAIKARAPGLRGRRFGLLAIGGRQTARPKRQAPRERRSRRLCPDTAAMYSGPAAAPRLRAAAREGRALPQGGSRPVQLRAGAADRYRIQARLRQSGGTAGLARDQAVRIYAFETGGNGTYDGQAGIVGNRKDARPISPAMGYNRLLSTNTVSLLAGTRRQVRRGVPTPRSARRAGAQSDRSQDRDAAEDDRLAAAPCRTPGPSTRGSPRPRKAEIGIHAAVFDSISVRCCRPGSCSNSVAVRETERAIGTADRGRARTDEFHRRRQRL